MKSAPQIVILAGNDDSVNLLYHELARQYSSIQVIIEESISRKKFLTYRIKKLGYVEVLGQILFQLLLVPYLKFRSKSRRQAILDKADLKDAPIPPENIHQVSSVNAKATYEILEAIQPDVIVVNATRIISRKVLQAFSVPFINIHAGITPQYRGVHGGYWALVEADLENCGVTVHLVDPGVDTGAVLYQEKIFPTSMDNYATYPILQQMTGLKLLKKALEDHTHSRLVIHKREGESRQWFHPTFWGYLWTWLKEGVK